MLYLLFQLDDDHYALSVAQVTGVLPLAAIKSIPGAPTWMAGVTKRHGAPVPVIDVPRLALSRPARPLRSIRLVLVRYEAGIRGDNAPLLGLVLEYAAHARRIDDASFATSGIATPDARQLDPVANLDDDLVQHVDAEVMLDAHMHVLLSPTAVG